MFSGRLSKGTHFPSKHSNHHHASTQVNGAVIEERTDGTGKLFIYGNNGCTLRYLSWIVIYLTVLIIHAVTSMMHLFKKLTTAIN